MTIKTFGIGCGAVVLAVLTFAGYRLANPWETFRFSGYEVRRNRFTERVQLRTGDTWQPALNNDSYAPTVPEADLARIKLASFAFGERGYFCGTATVIGDKPVTGRLAFNITVRDKTTQRRRTIESERSLRCNVNFQPGASQSFVIHSDMTPPNRFEKFVVVIVPVRTSDKP